MRIPPAVGVPFLTKWRSGPSSRICWPSSLRRRKSMKRGPARIEMRPATMPARRTRRHAVTPASALGDPFEAEDTRTFDEHAVTGLQLLAQERDRLVGVGDAPAAVDARTRPTEMSRSTPISSTARATSRCASSLYVAELGHLAEHGDAPATGGELPQMLERRAHRDRVRVPRIVDEQAAAREARSSWLRHSANSTSRRAGISRPSARAAANAFSALSARCCALKFTSVVPIDVRSSGGSNDSSRTSSPMRTTSMSVRRPRSPAARPPCRRRQRVDQLALRADDALERPDLLEMHGPMFVITPMCGRVNAHSSAIWPKPRIASSRMTISVSGSTRQTVSGTPISSL